MEPKVSEEYSKLYHYTTLEGLLGILQTNTLWATQYQFLNDYSELVLIRDKLIESYFHIAKEECRKLSRQRKDFQKISDRWDGLNKFAIHYAETMVNAAYKATGENIYIVSFCREDKNDYVNSNGLLSQWRGYGVGGGFTLVFDTKKMEEILNIEAERYTYDFNRFLMLFTAMTKINLKRSYLLIRPKSSIFLINVSIIISKVKGLQILP